MKLSLSNGIFSKLKVNSNFVAVKNLGFENIEFNMKAIKKENDTGVYREQKALFASGLKCLSVHSAVLHVKDPIEVHQAVYYGKISLECTRALNASLMTVHSNVSKNTTKNVRQQCLKDIFEEIKPFAKKLGIKLALENLSYNSSGFGKNLEEMEEILSIIDSDEELGITFDFCHALETGVVDEVVDKYCKKICNVHMANKAHKPFIEATPELTALLSNLHNCGYEGPITLELDSRTPIEEIEKTKVLFEQLLKKF